MQNPLSFEVCASGRSPRSSTQKQQQQSPARVLTGKPAELSVTLLQEVTHRGQVASPRKGAVKLEWEEVKVRWWEWLHGANQVYFSRN